MRNEDFTFRSPPFFFRSANQACATWAGKMVYEEVCQDYKSFIAVQWGKKKSIGAHFPAGMQVQIISGPESSLLGARALHGYRKDPVIRSYSGDGRRIQGRNCTKVRQKCMLWVIKFISFILRGCCAIGGNRLESHLFFTGMRDWWQKKIRNLNPHPVM